MKLYTIAIILSIFSGSYCLLILKSEGSWSKRRKKTLRDLLFFFLFGRPVLQVARFEVVCMKLWKENSISCTCLFPEFRSAHSGGLTPMLIITFTMFSSPAELRLISSVLTITKKNISVLKTVWQRDKRNDMNVKYRSENSLYSLFSINKCFVYIV